MNIPEFNRKLIGSFALICFLFTVIWLILFIYSLSIQGPIESSEAALASIANLTVLFYLTYANATMVTLTVTMLLAGLGVYLQQYAVWSAIGLAFVPVYTVLNLFVYLSQITILPHLVSLRPQSDLLLAQLVQAWPGSAVNVLNNLGYAVLGIPSLIFGVLLFRSNRTMRLASVLLAVSGVASIVGFAGIILDVAQLSLGSIASGAIFLLFLIALGINLFRKEID